MLPILANFASAYFMRIFDGELFGGGKSTATTDVAKLGKCQRSIEPSLYRLSRSRPANFCN